MARPIYVLLEGGIKDLNMPDQYRTLEHDARNAIWWSAVPHRTQWAPSNDRANVRLLANWPINGVPPIYSGFLHIGNPRGQVLDTPAGIYIPLSRWCERRGLIEVRPITFDELERRVSDDLGWRAQDELGFYGSYIEVARNALDMRIWE